jgi:hypothetical protein
MVLVLQPVSPQEHSAVFDRLCVIQHGLVADDFGRCALRPSTCAPRGKQPERWLDPGRASPSFLAPLWPHSAASLSACGIARRWTPRITSPCWSGESFFASQPPRGRPSLIDRGCPLQFKRFGTPAGTSFGDTILSSLGLVPGVRSLGGRGPLWAHLLVRRPSPYHLCGRSGMGSTWTDGE